MDDVILNLVENNVFMAIIDLQYTYFTFLENSEDKNFLKFRWNGRFWRFLGLPMGINCVSRYFSKLITYSFTYITTRDLQGFPYLDNSFIFGFT